MHPQPFFGGFWASAVRCLCVFVHPRGHPRASAGGLGVRRRFLSYQTSVYLIHIRLPAASALDFVEEAHRTDATTDTKQIFFFFLRLPNGQNGPVSRMFQPKTRHCTGPFNWGGAHCAGEKVKRKLGPFLQKSH